MTASSLFEDFSTTKIAVKQEPEVQEVQVSQADANDRVRSSFDDGYKEGWVDAQAAAASEQQQINADMATALQEAGFAYFEARQHIFNSMRPLLEAMVQQVLPPLAEETLIHHIIDKVQEIAQVTEPPLTILCSPETEAPLRALVEEQLSFPVDVKPEVTLTASQAMLQFADGQTAIDLGETIAKISTAVENFYNLSNEEERASA